MIIIGFQTLVTGMQADIISANRKLLEDVQFRVKKLELGLLDAEGERRQEEKNAGMRKNKQYIRIKLVCKCVQNYVKSMHLFWSR